jgi:hypothetical protein
MSLSILMGTLSFSLRVVREHHKMSRGYTGHAVSQYPNSESYDGEFVDGVRKSATKS